MCVCVFLSVSIPSGLRGGKECVCWGSGAVLLVGLGRGDVLEVLLVAASGWGWGLPRKATKFVSGLARLATFLLFSTSCY